MSPSIDTSSCDSIASTINATEPEDEKLQAYEPPNGGTTAWLQVLGGFFLYFNAWGLASAFGVFQSYYVTELLVGTHNSTISWIGSVSTFFIAASPIIWGPIYDQGHPRLLVFTGTFLVVFGLMMTSISTKFWQLILAQGLCVGLGGGALFLTCVSVIASYFTTRRAIATGIAAVGTSIAGIIYPIVFHQLQPMIGFGWAVRVIGFIALATLTVPCIVIKMGTKPKKSKLFDIALMKDSAFNIFNLASFFGFIGQYTPFFYIELYASGHGITPELSFYMLAFMNAGSIFGRIIPGLVADKFFHPLLVLGVCTGASAVLLFCWIAIKTSLPGMIIFCLLYGCVSGAFVSLQTPSIAKMTIDFSRIGTKFGINAFFASLGVLIGSPSAGAIKRKSWEGMQAFTGATMLISAVLIVATKVMYDQKQKKSIKNDGK